MNILVAVAVVILLIIVLLKQIQSAALMKTFDVRLTTLRRQAEELEKRFQGEIQLMNEHLVRLAKGESLNPASILEGKKFVDTTPEQARQLLDKRMQNYLLIFDVRSEKEYAQSHLPGAESVPMTHLESRLDQDDRDKDRPVLVYSAQGNRSKEACQLLTRNGFLHVYNLAGGMDTWTGPTETHVPMKQS